MVFVIKSPAPSDGGIEHEGHQYLCPSWVADRSSSMSRMTSCRACGVMIAESAGTCPRGGTILNRTGVVPIGPVMMLVIAVLFVLSQRYW
jgi:hypothetical protein